MEEQTGARLSSLRLWDLHLTRSSPRAALSMSRKVLRGDPSLREDLFTAGSKRTGWTDVLWGSACAAEFRHGLIQLPCSLINTLFLPPASGVHFPVLRWLCRLLSGLHARQSLPTRTDSRTSWIHLLTLA